MTPPINYDALNVNYRFLIERAVNTCEPGAKLLDFGCGKGDMVRGADAKGFDAHGVEYFGPGSGTNIKDVLTERGLLGDRVLEYDGQILPHADDSFDVVLSNQVFEHVPDLPQAITEVARVLKPGGVLITSFPYQDSAREGHSNVPFSHWFPKSRARVGWLLMFRLAGVGRLKKGRGKVEWAHFFNDWLEGNTFYRTGPEIDRIFKSNFGDVGYIEHAYSAFRLRARGKDGMARTVEHEGTRPLWRWLTRHMGGVVIEARK